MNNTYNINSPVIKLLTLPDLRIFRYLILFTLNFSIAGGFIWFMVENGIFETASQKYIALCFFVCLFYGNSFLNIYILTPRLLMQNKWIKYFISLFIMVSLIMTAIIVMQFSLMAYEKISERFDPFMVILNFMSSFLSLFLLFAGTTTLTLFKTWILDMQQAKELESATIQLELQLLENQINPHFLFNMLNNANIMIKKDPDTAIHIIGKLEDMLRYQMNDSAREKVYLKDEILFLDDFLDLEQSRRDHFDYTISIDGEPDNLQIPPLLFIAFVENAVKHNVDSRASSYVKICFSITKEKLIFVCENSIPKKPHKQKAGGIGLANIKRRLNLLYNNNYFLEQTKTDTIYIIKLELKL